MSRSTLRTLLVAITMLGIGWIVGHAQSSTPDFELSISAPSGQTTVECISGCELNWWERPNPNSARQARFTYSCTGQRCESGRIGGWLKP